MVFLALLTLIFGLPRTRDVQDLPFRLHALTNLVTVFVAVRVDVMHIVGLVAGTDFHATKRIPAVREMTPTAQEGHSAALTGPSTPRPIYANTVNEPYKSI
jgi:hypothetical protein